ncbi:MAG: hypothetical protein LBQ60_05525 [Bacteroidales bacterium]|nr:hypothetical protein [Bacteroidales bacterium]
MFIVLFSTACGSNKTLVEQTAENFITAVLSGDVTRVRTMVTPETAQKWGVGAEFIDLSLPSEVKQKLQSSKSPITKAVVNGDNARISLVAALPSVEGPVDELPFKKEGKRWLVDAPGLFAKALVNTE